MNRTTYRVRMDDGHLIQIQADSAASAISQSLLLRIGHRAVHCISGGVDHNGIPDDQAARIEYEIPSHDPVLVAPAKNTKKPKEPCELFDDAEILSESKRALSSKS